jgi:sigma-E factor negative regulatory protein RseB
MVSQPGPMVSNRASKVIEARRGGVLVERMYLDADTSLLLRREQFENGQGPSRTVEFETVTIGPASPSLDFPSPSPSPPSPSKVVNAAPKVVAAAHLPAGMSAPPILADGYQRVGLYKRSNSVQAVYSDGLYDLSVFGQRGRLDASEVPEGSRVTIRDSKGRRYAWAGGHVVLWHDGGTVYTAVSDAPLDQLLAAVRSLPTVTGSVSLLRRLRQVCRALVQPLTA